MFVNRFAEDSIQSVEFTFKLVFSNHGGSWVKNRLKRRKQSAIMLMQWQDGWVTKRYNMKRLLLALALSGAAAGVAGAQSTSYFENGGGSVGELVADGYEIKSAILNNGKYIVFLQKDRKAYACEFSKVNKSRCGEIK